MANENDWDGLVWAIFIGIALIALMSQCDRTVMRANGYRPPPPKDSYSVPPPSVYE